MDNIKTDAYYIAKALQNIEMIIQYTENLNFDDFSTDEKLIDAVMFRLVQMVENINRISKEYKEGHAEIKWGKIVGFRNGIVHEYDYTNYSIVYEIIQKDILELKQLFESSLQ